ncbi:hypothetical protein [Actinomadura sp. 3N407]|uniref:hypothetical protein n=1 Tax=Actinomadura sp. 3N407 TaxID=3457423 RepID=UPI003FCDCB89
MLEETWSTRDEPVLEAIVELIDAGNRLVRPHDLASHTGLDIETVQRALVALAHEDPPLFEYTDSTTYGSKYTELDSIRNPTGHARRTVRTWPTAETLADRLIAALQEAADNTEDEEQAGRLRRTGQWFGSAGRDVLVNLIASTITG